MISLKSLLESVGLTITSIGGTVDISGTLTIDEISEPVDVNLLSWPAAPLNVQLAEPVTIDGTVGTNTNITNNPLNTNITNNPLNANITNNPLNVNLTNASVATSTTITNNPLNIAEAVQNTTVSNIGQINVTAASVTVLAANANRKWFSVKNQHLSGDIYVFFGATATTTNGRLLSNGEEWNMGLKTDDRYIYTGVISAISANVISKPLSFIEGV